MAKQTPTKGKVSKTVKTLIPEIPIRITIEVIVKHEYPYQTQPINKHLITESAVAGDCPDNKFSYSFEKENATILSLIVEEFIKDEPGEAGEFTTCINDASPEPKVRVVALAKENLPGGRAALKLKFLGKDVFPAGLELKLGANGFLKLNTLAKLPI